MSVELSRYRQLEAQLRAIRAAHNDAESLQEELLLDYMELVWRELTIDE
jgi:hypothetical protein